MSENTTPPGRHACCANEILGRASKEATVTRQRHDRQCNSSAVVCYLYQSHKGTLDVNVASVWIQGRNEASQSITSKSEFHSYKTSCTNQTNHQRYRVDEAYPFGIAPRCVPLIGRGRSMRFCSSASERKTIIPGAWEYYQTWLFLSWRQKRGSSTVNWH